MNNDFLNIVCCHGLTGAICGDIIGLPYEFRGTRTKDFNFSMKFEDFSDDTILSIAIAKWVMGTERTEERLRQLLLEYARRFKHKNVWGRGFMQWVESDGTMDRKGVTSNGAVMRVAAIGYASDSLREVRRLADISARVSHDSDQASMAAQAVATAILLTRKGLSKESIMNYVMNWYDYQSYRTNITHLPEKIRETYQFEIECQKCVPEAFACWYHSKTYEETVRNAVSLGGDADTLAAIAGALAAATPGMAIPADIADRCFGLLPDDFRETLKAFTVQEQWGTTPPASESDFTDLGLSVLWRNSNLGASSPEQAGEFFAHNENAPKEVYKESNYKNAKKETAMVYDVPPMFEDYASPSSCDYTAYSTGTDTATALLGEGYRLPTPNELMELMSCCKQDYRTINSRRVLELTAPNGRTLILPCAGYRNDDYFDRPDEKDGYYPSRCSWNSVPGGGGPGADTGPNVADALKFGEGKPYDMSAVYRCVGLPVRAVKPLNDSPVSSNRWGRAINWMHE